MFYVHADEGLFNWWEMEKYDTFNEFEYWWKNFVELILGVFGFFNVGVVMSFVGEFMWLVLIGLFIGKFLGIWVCAMFSVKMLGFGMLEGFNSKDIFVLGCAVGIGFIVVLFVAMVAFFVGGIQDAVKMGVLVFFVAVIFIVVAGKVLGVEKVHVSFREMFVY